MSKTIIGIGRDHSASMHSVEVAARKDFNDVIHNIKTQAGEQGVEVSVCIEECGIKTLGNQTVNRLVKNGVPATQVETLTHYSTNGDNTPLWDAVLELLDAMQNSADYQEAGTACLVMFLTDGCNNSGRATGSQVAAKIRTLQATDRWTITFRVPKGARHEFTKHGIPSGNILEWQAGDAVELERSAAATTSAVTGYLQSRTRGVGATRSFYHTPDVAALTTASVTAAMTDATATIKEIFLVQPAEDGMKIQDFCLAKHGRFRLGEGYYELVKKEKLQEDKQVLVEFGNKYYCGTAGNARALLGLPATGEIKIQPAADKHRRVFIQSKAPNRKLVAGQTVIILPNV